ncbi:MAG: metallophosphoesterase family protein [Thermomicrobiales bacterium]
MSRYFAWGDLHGHHRELMALYGQLIDHGLDPGRDTLVFLGDYVDSGPATRQVLTQLITWQRAFPHWVFLLGNHEEMLLQARHAWAAGDPRTFDRWWYQGGEATWRSYLPPGQPEPAVNVNPFDAIDPDHLAWIERRPRLYETDGFIFVHAGLRPPLGPEACDPDDLIWIRDEFIYSRHDWGKRVIFGHTPMREPLVMPNKIGLDTLPRNTGFLTVALLDDATPDARPTFFAQPAFAES